MKDVILKLTSLTAYHLLDVMSIVTSNINDNMFLERINDTICKSV